MKHSFRARCFLLILFSNTNLFAQKDSVPHPTLKTFIGCSPSVLTGWEPKKGQFYSPDWYKGGREVSQRSMGFHYGIIAAVKISSSAFYITSGAELSSYDYSDFRLSPARDPRYPTTADTLRDTSYTGYVVNSLHVPLYFQIPIIKRKVFLSARAGLMNDFLYSESYNIVYSETIGGASKETVDAIDNNPGIHLSAVRFNLGMDLEYHVPLSHIIPMISINYASPSLTEDENFLHYSSVLSFIFGFGYCFYKK